MFILFTGDLNPFWIVPMLGTHNAWESDGLGVSRFIFIIRVRHQIWLSYFLVLAAPPHQRSAKKLMHDDEHARRSPRVEWWILAYLISPGLPFICLRVGRAIGTVECIFGVLAGLVAHLGMVSVLTQTNGDPLQIFITLLLGVSLVAVLMWQYLAGERSGFWSSGAKRQWRIAGRLFGGLVGVAVALSVVMFHLTHRAG